MAKYIVRISAPLALGAALMLGACKADSAKQDTAALGKDTALNRDLAMANRDSAAQPQLKDVPPANTPTTKAPVATRPTPTPRPTTSRPATRPTTPTTTTRPTENGTVTRTTTPSSGGGAVGSIAAGTELTLNPTTTVCTNTNAVGDHISATVANSVSGTNGAVIPAGSTVSLTITKLKRSDNSNDPIQMEFAVNSVTYNGHTYPLDASVQSASVDRVRNEPKSKDAQKVAIGAAAGAIAGQILGKNTKSTVIGGAVGAAAGAATAAATANYEGCIKPTGTIVVKLNSAAQVKV